MAATMVTNAHAVPGCGGWAIQETLHMVRYGASPLVFCYTVLGGTARAPRTPEQHGQHS